MNSITIQNNICIITLNNKPHNYLEQPEFINTSVLKNTINSNNCKAIVITGAGRHFSAGANLNNLKEMVANNILFDEIEKGKALLKVLKKFLLPIIVCIEGTCFGGGLEIALHADIKIASHKALFAFPETNLDLIPGLGGIVNLVGITGKSKALELVLKGDIIDAQTAKDLSIIDYLDDAKKTLETGLNLAEKLTQQRPTQIIKAVIELVRNAETLPYDQALNRETELFCQLANKAMRDE